MHLIISGCCYRHGQSGVYKIQFPSLFVLREKNLWIFRIIQIRSHTKKRKKVIMMKLQLDSDGIVMSKIKLWKYQMRKKLQILT